MPVTENVTLCDTLRDAESDTDTAMEAVGRSSFVRVPSTVVDRVCSPVSCIETVRAAEADTLSRADGEASSVRVRVSDVVTCSVMECESSVNSVKVALNEPRCCETDGVADDCSVRAVCDSVTDLLSDDETVRVNVDAAESLRVGDSLALRPGDNVSESEAPGVVDPLPVKVREASCVSERVHVLGLDSVRLVGETVSSGDSVTGSEFDMEKERVHVRSRGDTVVEPLRENSPSVLDCVSVVDIVSVSNCVDVRDKLDAVSWKPVAVVLKVVVNETLSLAVVVCACVAVDVGEGSDGVNVSAAVVETVTVSVTVLPHVLVLVRDGM